MSTMTAERPAAAPAPPAADPETSPVVQVAHLDHFYGEGAARNQVLFDNTIAVPVVPSVC